MAVTASAVALKTAKAVIVPSPEGSNIFETLENKLIAILINLVLPSDVLASVITTEIVKIKPYLRLFSCGIIIFLCAMVVSATTSIASPNGDINYPAALQGIVNQSFNTLNSSPQLTPIGGPENYKITAGFHDISYYNYFGHWHEGADLIPSQFYYENDPGYKAINEIVLYATCNGQAYSSIDDAGAFFVSIRCTDNKHSVLLVHNKYNFFPVNERVQVLAGQPVAVMGSTGHSTGVHVHYVVKDIETGKYLDPLFVH